jgi:hypothetical protein
MAENAYKPKDEEYTSVTTASVGLMTLLRKLPLLNNHSFKDGVPVQYLPKVLYVVLFLLVYIWNAHQGDKLIREIAVLKGEVNDLRADYTTLKADLMFRSKQSEVANQVKDLGLEESLEPPQKIVLENE